MGRSVLREPREADDAKRIREALDQFEDAWRADGSVDLGRFLPPPGDPLRPALLLELIRADLALRWNHGPHLEIEAYQKSYPELGQTAAARETAPRSVPPATAPVPGRTVPGLRRPAAARRPGTARPR